jgi:hypothetical protein
MKRSEPRIDRKKAPQAADLGAVRTLGLLDPESRLTPLGRVLIDSGPGSEDGPTRFRSR